MKAHHGQPHARVKHHVLDVITSSHHNTPAAILDSMFVDVTEPSRDGLLGFLLLQAMSSLLRMQLSVALVAQPQCLQQQKQQ